MKAVQARHQPIGSESEIGRYLQHLMLMLCADCTQSRVDILQSELNLLEKDHASLSQFDAAINAVEQPRGQLFFQPFDLLADGRLSGAELIGGGRKAALASRCFECAKQIQGQVTEGVIHKLCLS
ncbi:hypothetical protein D3C84_1035540 [compost metagenome]